MARPLSSRVESWRASGEIETFRSRAIWTRPPRADAGDGPALLFLHGFPSSSFDFRLLVGELGEPEALLFDFLGFGLSEKPRDHTYTLYWQADLAEELVRRHLPGRDVFVVAHDMGTSVATELLARDVEGRLSFPLAGALLFNGSMLVERASLTSAQKLLRSPLGPVVSRLASERFFRHGFAPLFSDAHPLSEEEAVDQWALICRDGGRLLGHRTIHYIGERIRFADRWHGALRDWDGPLSLAWGMLDPVATTNVLDGIRELRPHAPVDELEGLGHYPQLEDPARVSASVREAVARAG